MKDSVFYLEYFLEVPLVLIDSAHHTSTEAQLREDEISLAQPGVSHPLHQAGLVPARQVGGRQGRQGRDRHRRGGDGN